MNGRDDSRRQFALEVPVAGGAVGLDGSGAGHDSTTPESCVRRPEEASDERALPCGVAGENALDAALESRLVDGARDVLAGEFVERVGPSDGVSDAAVDPSGDEDDRGRETDRREEPSAGEEGETERVHLARQEEREAGEGERRPEDREADADETEGGDDHGEGEHDSEQCERSGVGHLGVHT